MTKHDITDFVKWYFALYWVSWIIKWLILLHLYIRMIHAPIQLKNDSRQVWELEILWKYLKVEYLHAAISNLYGYTKSFYNALSYEKASS